MPLSRSSQILAFLLAVTAFFFVAQQIPALSFLYFGEVNTPYYIVFFLLGITSLAILFKQHQRNFEALVRSSLRLFFPMEAIIILGLFLSANFHFLIFAQAGLYGLIAFIAWAVRALRGERARYPETPTVPFRLAGWIQEQGLKELFLVFIITLVFLSFGLSNLSRFAAVDEPLWLEGRIPKFWKNLGEGDLDKTNISDKPGITVTLATGAGLLFADPKEYLDTRFVYSAKNPDADIQDLYLAFRLPELIVIALFLPFFYFLLSPLIGKRAALFSYAFIALAPITLGMSKIINPDSLLWLFVPLSFLSYLLFLEKRQFRILFLSAFFLGLALLTKYVANFLFVYFFGFIFLSYLYARGTSIGLSFAEHFRRELTHFCLWLGTGLSVFYVLLPAVWEEPQELFTSTILSEAFEKVAPLFLILIALVFIDRRFFAARFSTTLLDRLRQVRSGLSFAVLTLFLVSLLLTLVNGMLGMPWFDFMQILASPKSIYQTEGPFSIFLTNFFPLLFGLPPLTLLALLFAVILAFRKKTEESTASWLTLSIAIFILLYYLGSTVNQVVLIHRYQIVLYPLAAILAGLGANALFTWLSEKFPRFAVLDTRYAVGVLFVVVLLTLTLARTPFPLSYASPLLPSEYTIDIKDMGSGSYEAAMYLNSLPDAQNLAIWTDKRGVCKFFVGKCTDGFNFKEIPTTELDYIFVSSGRESRTDRMMSNPYLLNDAGLVRFDTYYTKANPVFELLINGRAAHFVRVYRFEP